MATPNDTGAHAPTQPRNPLTSNLGPEGTVNVCQQVLAVVEKATSEIGVHASDEDDGMGFYYVISCVREALQ